MKWPLLATPEHLRAHPRPEAFWPVDALELTLQLLG